MVNFSWIKKNSKTVALQRQSDDLRQMRQFLEQTSGHGLTLQTSHEYGKVVADFREIIMSSFQAI
jgi:hypothetical protein